MADKIDGIRQTGIPTGQGRTGAANPRREADGADMHRTTPIRGDRVELTDEARKVQALEAKIAGQPEVDDARVEAVRARIDEGRFEIDADRIAEKLLAAEKKLP